MQKEIYIVQARPIVKKEFEIPRSFLNLKQFINLEKFRGTTILHGSSSVRKCTSDNIIIVGKISESYKIWTPTRETVECILLETFAPETSHEATILRGEGIIVGSFDEYDNFEGLLESNSLLFCPQHGAIVIEPQSLESSIEPIEGWKNYPAPLAFSFTDELWRPLLNLS